MSLPLHLGAHVRLLGPIPCLDDDWKHLTAVVVADPSEYEDFEEDERAGHVDLQYDDVNNGQPFFMPRHLVAVLTPAGDADDNVNVEAEDVFHAFDALAPATSASADVSTMDLQQLVESAYGWENDELPAGQLINKNFLYTPPFDDSIGDGLLAFILRETSPDGDPKNSREHWREACRRMRHCADEVQRVSTELALRFLIEFPDEAL